MTHDAAHPSVVVVVHVETLKPERPDLVFLALSVSDAAEDVIAVIRAGARGFVLDAFSGDPPITFADPPLGRLSPREREVMRLIARGHTHKEIAPGGRPTGDPSSALSSALAVGEPRIRAVFRC